MTPLVFIQRLAALVTRLRQPAPGSLATRASDRFGAVNSGAASVSEGSSAGTDHYVLAGRYQSEAVVQLGLAAGSNAAEAAVHLDRPYHLIATMTMSEAAAKLGVNNRRIRRLIKEGLLSAE